MAGRGWKLWPSRFQSKADAAQQALASIAAAQGEVAQRLPQAQHA